MKNLITLLFLLLTTHLFSQDLIADNDGSLKIVYDQIEAQIGDKKYLELPLEKKSEKKGRMEIISQNDQCILAKYIATGKRGGFSDSKYRSNGIHGHAGIEKVPVTFMYIFDKQKNILYSERYNKTRKSKGKVLKKIREHFGDCEPLMSKLESNANKKTYSKEERKKRGVFMTKWVALMDGINYTSCK